MNLHPLVPKSHFEKFPNILFLKMRQNGNIKGTEKISNNKTANQKRQL